VSSYLPVALALLGPAIAGVIAVHVASRTRLAGLQSWKRETKRAIYDRFLSHAQRLLIECEARNPRGGGPAEGGPEALHEAYRSFFEVYASLQTVAKLEVVDAARVYAYRLQELEMQTVGGRSVLDRTTFDIVARLVREARHDVIDGMRRDLDVGESAAPSKLYNPFTGTGLERPYAERLAAQLEAARQAADRARPGWGSGGADTPA